MTDVERTDAFDILATVIQEPYHRANRHIYMPAAEELRKIAVACKHQRYIARVILDNKAPPAAECVWHMHVRTLEHREHLEEPSPFSDPYTHGFYQSLTPGEFFLRPLSCETTSDHGTRRAARSASV